MVDKNKGATAFDELIREGPKITVLSDNPVSLCDMKSDIFDFSYHLGPIYDIIRHKNTKMPLTIGVYGKWGSGKTTAMQWLYDALEKWKKLEESKGRITTRNLWFYPWKYHDKEDVWRGLISEVIIKAIDVKEASVKTVMSAIKQFGLFMGRNFLHVLDNINLQAKAGKEEAGIEAKAELSLGMVKKIIEEYQRTAHPEKPFLNDFEQALTSWLQDTLKDNNERMVIFIDDLDRCMPDVALQVLEALKLYLKIDRLIFVIGMDRGVVEQAVAAYYEEKKIKDIDPKLYLDKMFQVELQLSPSREQMETYLDEQLDKVNYREYLEEKDEKGDKKFYELFKRLITRFGGRNPREVKRLINSSLIRGAGAEKIKTGAEQ